MDSSNPASLDEEVTLLGMEGRSFRSTATMEEEGTGRFEWLGDEMGSFCFVFGERVGEIFLKERGNVYGFLGFCDGWFPFCWRRDDDGKTSLQV